MKPRNAQSAAAIIDTIIAAGVNFAVSGPISSSGYLMTKYEKRPLHCSRWNFIVSTNPCVRVMAAEQKSSVKYRVYQPRHANALNATRSTSVTIASDARTKRSFTRRLPPAGTHRPHSARVPRP
jgi:hypothetical protein